MPGFHWRTSSSFWSPCSSSGGVAKKKSALKLSWGRSKEWLKLGFSEVRWKGGGLRKVRAVLNGLVVEIFSRVNLDVEEKLESWEFVDWTSWEREWA